MEQGITLSHPVGTVSEPPNLVVAERARLWGKGFEDIPKPTPSHKALSCTVFPSSLGPPERSLQTLRGGVALRESPLAYGKSKGLSCMVISPAGTLQPPIWLAARSQPSYTFAAQRALGHLLGWEREGSPNCTLEAC